MVEPPGKRVSGRVREEKQLTPIRGEMGVSPPEYGVFTYGTVNRCILESTVHVIQLREG